MVKGKLLAMLFIQGQHGICVKWTEFRYFEHRAWRERVINIFQHKSEEIKGIKKTNKNINKRG